ncbi:MATE family efflux transporter [Fusobacterium vincentii]|uniref:MATE family efflux transporter n=1 Tax=Fusobacterium vincentii TaxID=155615 RepID=UPI0030CCD322
MLDKTSFRKTVFAFLLPMAIQNLINVAISSTDVIMLGRYSEVALSASSLASQIQFILILLFFGIGSGATVLTAQYWGKKDTKTIEKILAIGIKIAFGLSLLFFIFAFFFSRVAMRIFTNDEVTILEGIKYLKIVSFSYLTTSISIVYLVTMRSVERVGVSTVAYATSFVTNFIINYLLIFGSFGFAKMGVKGAAIGTLVARLVELGIVFYYNSKNHHFVSIKWKYIKSLDPILKKDFIKYSAPTMMNELLWAGGTAAGIAILGRLGNSIVAANSITSVVRQLAMVFAFGLANTAAIMVGKEIGKKDFNTAEIYAKKLLLYSFLSSLLGVALLFVVKPFIIKKFALNAEVEDYLNLTLSILFYYIPLQSISAVLIVGVFRAGGDTKFALVADVFPLWCGSVLISAFAAFYLNLPTKLIYLLIMSDEIIKQPLIIWRYRSKKWINNVTRELN